VVDVDAVVWVIEALHLNAGDKAVLPLLQDGAPLIIAVNKIDEVGNKNELLPFMQKLQELANPRAIVPVSAKTGIGADDLLATIRGVLPVRERLYGEDEITTASERTMAAELLREKLFRLLGEELPYSAMVEIEKFEIVDGLRRIHAGIIVDKAGHKGIVIGKGGEKLKQIASQARSDMEKLFGGKVFLEVWVKVKSGWADDAVIATQRAAYAAAPDAAARRAVAEELHRRAAEAGFYMPLGQFVAASAWRAELQGVLPGPAMFLWNLSRP
jgi:GTP-binding protein Era